MKFKIFIEENEKLIKIFLSLIAVLVPAFLAFNTYSQKSETHNQNSNPIQLNGENISDNKITQTNIQTQIIHKSEYDIKKDKITDEAKSFVNDFYQNLNNRNFEKIEKYYHSGFSQQEDVKVYFSQNNWKRFMSCINKNINLNNIELLDNHTVNNDNKNRRGFSYGITYSVKEKTYNEDWEMVWVDEGLTGEYKLAWLICNTTGCSTNPLYNYRKHCI